MQDLADARVSVTGHAKALPGNRQDAVKQVYKSKNPESFWADFGDFQPFYMEEIVGVHFNGGFGRAGRKVSSRPVCPAFSILCPSCCTTSLHTLCVRVTQNLVQPEHTAGFMRASYQAVLHSESTAAGRTAATQFSASGLHVSD